MKKDRAITLLGGTVAEAARAVGVSSSAISQWPEELPRRIEDRVLAVLARRHLVHLLEERGVGSDGLHNEIRSVATSQPTAA